jgi:DNA primase
MSRPHLDSPRAVSPVPEDVHYPSRMVAALRPLQLVLPTASLAVAARSGELGSIGSGHPRAEQDARFVHCPSMGRAAVLLLDLARHQTMARGRLSDSRSIHHPRLGLDRRSPYSAGGGEQFLNRNAIDELKRQIPLLDYLRAQEWQPGRRIRNGRLMGLCPLHADHSPSFLVDPCRNLFYCYGCARGGDVIRFAELYHHVKFPQAVALLRQWRGVSPLLEEVANFYRVHLSHHPEAVSYLQQRGLYAPEVLDHMRIGYAPGRCLRAWLYQLGYAPQALHQAGLVNEDGNDTYARRIVFPLENNLYGRSIGDAAPHRFLPGGKGGLYAWQQVHQCDEIILVEGLFDYAVLWQAGFHNVTCLLGSHPNARQFQQLCDRPRTIYLAFDFDVNESGQLAAQSLTRRLRAQGECAFHVLLPEGHDPNSFFVQGGSAQQFQRLLEAARP